MNEVPRYNVKEAADNHLHRINQSVRKGERYYSKTPGIRNYQVQLAPHPLGDPNRKGLIVSESDQRFFLNTHFSMDLLLDNEGNVLGLGSGLSSDPGGFSLFHFPNGHADGPYYLIYFQVDPQNLTEAQMSGIACCEQITNSKGEVKTANSFGTALPGESKFTELQMGVLRDIPSRVNWFETMRMHLEGIMPEDGKPLTAERIYMDPLIRA